MGKFIVGDVVKRVAEFKNQGVERGDVVVVAAVDGDYFGTPRDAGADHFVGNYELVSAAQATPAYTIEHVIPLIKDARQLAAAADTLANRGSDTKFVDGFIQELYAEIGEKVCAAVEVDA